MGKLLNDKNNYFNRLDLDFSREKTTLVRYLLIKGYNLSELQPYLTAFNYFCEHKTEYDGATFMKDLVDFNGLDLDAMLHDYQYIKLNVSSNIVYKWKSDWIYAKGQERKGKGSYSSFSRFLLLTIMALPIMAYSLISRGYMSSDNKVILNEEYDVLIG